MTFSWQLQQPLNAVIFDCDGTLSRLEGIDELAVQNSVGEVVKDLTSNAMTSTGVTYSLYEERLSLVKPRRDQVEALGKEYFDERTPDVAEVIKVLQRSGKTVLIMSAGLKPAVDIFADALNVPHSHVYAVDVEFDANGNYQNFDHSSPLTGPGGKGHLVQQLHAQYPALMHIGDGINDVDAKDFVDRFVGYGGVFYRESILGHSDFYIRSPSLAPVLALSLTADESQQLTSSDRALYDKGLGLIEDSEVILSECST